MGFLPRFLVGTKKTVCVARRDSLNLNTQRMTAKDVLTGLQGSQEIRTSGVFPGFAFDVFPSAFHSASDGMVVSHRRAVIRDYFLPDQTMVNIIKGERVMDQTKSQFVKAYILDLRIPSPDRVTYPLLYWETWLMRLLCWGSSMMQASVLWQNQV